MKLLHKLAALGRWAVGFLPVGGASSPDPTPAEVARHHREALCELRACLEPHLDQPDALHHDRCKAFLAAH